MSKQIVRRGITVLALTAALALAGAHPAAAQDLGLFERGMRWLTSFLAMPAAQQERTGNSAQTQTVPQKSSGTTDPTGKVVPGDKGLGVDPNGVV
jgi:hypothetical protein